ncbi:hypothetical protein PILCRDRAFT_822551 [Piloderma croceum F 1598]|uniref:DUF7918 domain-containing protein n=1 Tax=Piloderma croceum (strain F 1598) TaxID=765440 RepID=A0A0C3FKF0_PILCF|nr:hypothetical protein PILCRDRAFT_822551 [Piloderma croceum F 1598]
MVTAGYVYLDGVKCGGRFIWKSAHTQVNTVERSSAATSMTTERPYVFSPIEFTDEDTSLYQNASLHALGEISIKIWRVAVEIGGARSDPSTIFPDEQKVNEREKKALVHRVKLGEEVQATQSKVCTCAKLDSEPTVTFLFKYRPLDMLKANGLVPITSGKKRRAIVDPDEDNVKKEGSEIEDDDAEIKTLEERMNILKARRAHRSGTGKRIKTEPQNENTFASTEIIDLT